jgi:hypothetical protein
MENEFDDNMEKEIKKERERMLKLIDEFSEKRLKVTTNDYNWDDMNSIFQWSWLSEFKYVKYGREFLVTQKDILITQVQELQSYKG